jgi:NTE family protein
LAEFAAALRALLSELGQESEIEAGSWLWKEGDPGEDVVLVKKGVLQVVHEGPEGELMVLRDLEPGSVLGEIACLDTCAPPACAPRRLAESHGSRPRSSASW